MMTLYLCVDDNLGLLFNKRRQSRDIRVLEDMAAPLAAPLTIDPFSEKLLADAGIPYCLACETLHEDAHYFVENRCPQELIGQASTIVLYRWNRHYPADMYFTADLSAEGFSLAETLEFPGKSHEKITKEVYTR